MWKVPTSIKTKEIELQPNSLKIRQGFLGKWQEVSLKAVTSCETDRKNNFILKRANGDSTVLKMRPTGPSAMMAIRLLIWTLAQRGVPIYLEGTRMKQLPSVWGPETHENALEYCKTITRLLDKRLAHYQARYANKGITFRSWTSIGQQTVGRPDMGAQYVVAAFMDDKIARRIDGDKKYLAIWSDDLMRTMNGTIYVMLNGEQLLEQEGQKAFANFWSALDHSQLEPSNTVAQALEENLTASMRVKQGWKAWLLEKDEKKPDENLSALPDDGAVADEAAADGDH